MKKKLFSIATALLVLLSALAIPVGAQTPSAPKPSNLLILGDSIATGYGLSSGEPSYAKQLEQAFGLTDSTCVNLAVDGLTSDGLLTQIQTPADQAAIANADTIVISIGGNNVLGPFISTLKTALGLPPTATNANLEAAIAANPTAVTTAITQAMANPMVQAQFASAVTTFGTNFSQIVGPIKTANPTAKLYIQTVYNPFDGLPGFDALSTAADTFIQGTTTAPGLNWIISSFASDARYTVADVHAAFAGKAAAYTNMAQFDIHPNALGHDVIFNTLYKSITGQPYTYTATFDSNGGSSVSAGQAALGGTFSKPADPTRSGYTFGGWYTDSSPTQPYDFSTPVTASVKLYAKWTAVPVSTYTATFDSNGGSGISSEQAASGGTFSKPADPTRSGYTFGGWYTDSALTQLYDFSTPVAASVKLYAKWTAESPASSPTPNPKTGDSGAWPLIPLSVLGGGLAIGMIFLRRRKI